MDRTSEQRLDTGASVCTRTHKRKDLEYRLNTVKIAMILFVIMAAAAGGGEQPTPHQRPEAHGSEKQIRVIGHRGAAGLAPENTLAAVEKAIEINVEAVELDVQLSRDGQLVVYHDYTLNSGTTRQPDGRWVKGTVAIKSLSLAELKTYDVGRVNPLSIYAIRYAHQQAKDGERIPTLKEVLSLFNKPGSNHKPQLWIEIKTSPESRHPSSSPEQVADALIRLLQQAQLSQPIFILSFDWRALYHVQRIAPNMPTAYLTRLGGDVRNIKPNKSGASPWTAPIDVDDFQGSIPKAIHAAGGRYWAPHHREVSKSQIEEAHLLGLEVIVWSPDSDSRWRRLIGMGVDGIITNRPDKLQAMLDHR